MNVLAIDTSSHTLTVVLAKNNQIEGQLSIRADRSHSTKLMPAIETLLDQTETQAADLGEIVVAVGPGSYTGVRIGVTTAKTMSWALGIPLYPVSSLQVLTYKAVLSNDLVCPLIDARRGLVYTGLYEQQNGEMVEVMADCNTLLTDWLKKLETMNQSITFVGPEIDIFRETITSVLGERATFIPDMCGYPDAHCLITAKQFAQSVDPHNVLPNYLRLSQAEANWMRQQERKISDV